MGFGVQGLGCLKVAAGRKAILLACFLKPRDGPTYLSRASLYDFLVSVLKRVSFSNPGWIKRVWDLGLKVARGLGFRVKGQEGPKTLHIYYHYGVGSHITFKPSLVWFWGSSSKTVVHLDPLRNIWNLLSRFKQLSE